MLYRFEDYTLDDRTRELRRGAALQPVEPQVFDLLLLLVENRDRVVSREEIFREVWQGRVVTDAVLSTRINAVRKAIGDNGAEQRLVRTLHGRGFRFVAPLRELPLFDTAESPGHTMSRLRPADFDQSAIAVMPFSCDATECRRFCDEIGESIMLGLSRVPWLRVIASSRVLSMRRQSRGVRQLGGARGAAYLLEGRLRRLADGFRVFVELIDAETDVQIWVGRYEPEGDSVQLPHKKIASQIVLAIKKHLSRSAIISAWRKQAGDLAVWDHVLRAIALINTRRKSDWIVASKLLLEAVKKDSTSVQAHALLSYVTGVGIAAGWHHRKAALALAFDASHRALSLNCDDPWAQIAMGFAAAWNRQPEEAVLHYQEALRLDPEFSYARTLLGAALCYLGEHRQALAETSAARQFMDADLFGQGNAGVNNNTIAISHFVAGDYRRGREFGEKALVESPQLPTVHRILIFNQALGGDLRQAREVARKLKRLVPGTSVKAITEWSPFTRADERKKIVEAYRLAGLK